MRSVILLTFVLAVSSVFAAESKQAMIASVQGDAQVLSPGPDGNGKAMLTFEGVKYHFTKAKIGQKVISKEVIMTATDGKVKIIFEKGDVVIIGPSTSLIIPEITSKVSKNKELDLMYGKVRAMIDKDGPLSGVKIKTPVAVAGVRGTDLYVSFSKGENVTEVQVLRGEVELTSIVKNKNELPPKSVIIRLGEIGKIESHNPAEIKTSSKEDLTKVQKETTVVKDKSVEISEPVKKQVEIAEKMAIENIVKDVKRYDPQAAQRLADKKLENTEDVNTVVLHEVYKTAPASSVKNKPSRKDLEENPNDIYQQYFKPLSL
jgi:hypothetical protein